MINPQNQRVTKMVEVLEQTNLFSADEMTLIEDYLSGNEQEEALEKLTFHDLTTVPDSVSSKMRSLAYDLVNKGREEEAGRLGRLLFAVGQSTCHEMMPSQSYYSFDKDSILVPEPEKKAAVYAAKIGMNEYQINRFALPNLVKLADNDPEILKKAMNYQKNNYENGRLMLYTVYFKMKYKNVRLVEKGTDGKTGGFLAGMGKMLGIGESNEEPVMELDARDAVLLKQYGDILVNSLPSLLKRAPRLELDEISNAVGRDKVDDRILKMVRSYSGADRFMLRILGGCAFVNFRQSVCLGNILKICLAADTEMMLDIMENMDLRGELDEIGGEFDILFGIDCRKLIKWAAAKGKNRILKSQFGRNREVYLQYMNTADFDTFNRMNVIVGKLDPALYRERKEKEIFRQQTKVVEAFLQTADAKVQQEVRDYLKGEKGIETLYAISDTLRGNNNYRWGGKHWGILQSYQQGYGHDALSNRCEAFLMLCGAFCNTNSLREAGEVREDRVRRLFSAVDSEKLSLKYQLDGYADAFDSLYMDKWKEALKNAAKEVFRGYLEQRRDETVTAFREAGSTGRCFGIQMLAASPEENKAVILGFSQDTSKAVKEELLQVLYGQKNWEEDVLKLLASKKAGEREIAIRVLTRWDSEKYTAVLTESLEKEKNGKVRSLLETALQVNSHSGNGGGKAITQEDLVKELHKGNKKRSLAWAYETPFSKVHKKDGQEAEEEYLQAIFLSYAAMSPCGVSPSAAVLAEALDEKEFAVYANELFDKWMEAGAESKKRWVLYAASIHGGDDIVKKLHHQIQEWPLAARGAIASEAVQALALNPQPQALLIVDGISRKFKFKQVKAAAGKALEFAASQLGITTEELADRIVPDLGFNENMERCFDYGERKFTVAITTALEIEVFDENGKKLKNLPAPGKRDDETKAPAAYEEFKQMKKQMKTTVASQKMRLEMALSTGRQWTVGAWENLFVKNPVMHQFATGLIWGMYEDRKLVSTFRYMEDGTFNTQEEDEFEMPGEGIVGIVHPIELDEEDRKAWKEQLEDYEITQPVEQLDRQVFLRTKEEEEQKSLERFGGYIVNDLSLGGKLQALGWYRGSVQDAGGFYSYYREDKELGLGVELHFSGSFVGGENEDVTVYEARFYNAGGNVVDENGQVVMNAGIRRGSYVYDEANDSNSYCLKEVPERYFSEIVLQLSKAVASSKEKNANWKKNR